MVDTAVRAHDCRMGQIGLAQLGQCRVPLEHKFDSPLPLLWILNDGSIGRDRESLDLPRILEVATNDDGDAAVSLDSRISGFASK